MKTTEWILAQLEGEAPRTRRALERVPSIYGPTADDKQFA